MSPELAITPPHLYRSEAFVEDLDLLPTPWLVERSDSGSMARTAAWLLAVPGAVAVLAGAVVVATLPV